MRLSTIGDAETLRAVDPYGRDGIDMEEVDFRKDGAENIYKFGYYDEMTRNDIFTFCLEINSKFHEFIEVTEESLQTWRLRNITEQKKYGAAFAIDEDVDLWYNRWRGSVNIIFKFHRTNGVYEVRVLQGGSKQNPPTDFDMSALRDHSNFGGTVLLATLGDGKVLMSVQASTRWDGQHAIVALNIREFIVDRRSKSDAESNDILWRMDEMNDAIAKTPR